MAPGGSFGASWPRGPQAGPGGGRGGAGRGPREAFPLLPDLLGPRKGRKERSKKEGEGVPEKLHGAPPPGPYPYSWVALPSGSLKRKLVVSIRKFWHLGLGTVRPQMLNLTSE